MLIQTLFHDFFNFIFPRTCPSCQEILVQNEHVICTGCRHALPLTNFHVVNENETKKVFAGRANVQHAFSLLHFEKKGRTQALMHALKYKGQKEIGTELGNWTLPKLQQTTWAQQLEVIVPVPLHKKRLRERGYNQVEGFAKTLAEGLQLGYNDRCLVKTRGAQSQVFKNLAARYKNVQHSFQVLPQETKPLEGKHILLVDDILTTGATLETCATLLNNIPNTKISIVTMAKTRSV